MKEALTTAISLCILFFVVVCSAKVPDIVGMEQEHDDHLTHIYRTFNETPGFDHWLEYGRHYDFNIHHLKTIHPPSVKIKLLEIGVQSGGSTRVWKRYFEDRLQYVGLDINPRCKRSESLSENIQIEIGSQLNMTFLQEICQKYGPFHMIVDDGGHTAEMMIRSFEQLYPKCMIDYGVYIIEDTHTMNYKLFLDSTTEYNGKTVFDYFAKILQRQIMYPPEKILYDDLARKVYSIVFYDSLIFIHYRASWQPLHRVKMGNDWIPYEES